MSHRKTKINVRLLRRVAKHILEEPRRLDMGVLVDRPNPDYSLNVPPCGTTGCIAGWACLLTNPTIKSKGHGWGLWNKGKRLLGLTANESERLFNPPEDAISSDEDGWDTLKGFYWPVKFAKRYVEAKTARGRANATVARIEHFIKTNGAE